MFVCLSFNISASHDCSVRLWSLGGRYLGTLGTPLPWMSLSPFEPVKENEQEFRMPPDIKKVASSTTLRVSGVGEGGGGGRLNSLVIERFSLELELELYC